MTTPDLVSVIVPVFNEETRMRSCLEALRAQTYPRERVEVIVVDNGSTDRTAEIVRGFGAVTLLAEPGGGSYAARNAGLAAAHGDVIAFTDADCLPAPQWLEAGVRALREEPRPGLVAGRIDVFPRKAEAPSFIEALDMVTGLRQEDFAQRPVAPFAATANAFTTRAVLDRVGAFRADLYSSGDVEFGTRVASAGLRVTYAPDAIVRHPARASWSAAVRRLQRVRHGHYMTGNVPSWAHVLFDWRGGVRDAGRAFRRRDLPVGTRIKAAAAAIAMTGVGRWIALLLRVTGRPFLRRESLKGY